MAMLQLSIDNREGDIVALQNKQEVLLTNICPFAAGDRLGLPRNAGRRRELREDHRETREDRREGN